MSVLDTLPEDSRGNGSLEYAVRDDGFGEDHPGLFEIIARQRYKGNPRKTGKLLLFCDYGKASLCLTDAEREMVAFYKSESFGEALDGIERALQGGSVDWRPDRRRRV